MKTTSLCLFSLLLWTVSSLTCQAQNGASPLFHNGGPAWKLTCTIQVISGAGDTYYVSSPGQDANVTVDANFTYTCTNVGNEAGTADLTYTSTVGVEGAPNSSSVTGYAMEYLLPGFGWTSPTQSPSCTNSLPPGNYQSIINGYIIETGTGTNFSKSAGGSISVLVEG